MELGFRSVHPALVAWIVIASAATLALTVLDKARARRGRRRIPEATLLGLALLGGSPGLLVAMLLARHKTRKASFLLKLALVVAAQVALAWLLSR